MGRDCIRYCFIAYDVYQITQEGWTPVNAAALAADITCAVLPVATGGGAGIRAAVAGGESALEFSKAAVRVPEAVRGAQAAEKVLQQSTSLFAKGENPDTIRGRQAHKNYPNALGPDYEYNRELPSGKRPDAIDKKNNIVRELKPDNPRAIAKGTKQLRGYLQELQRITGQIWQGFVDIYRK